MTDSELIRAVADKVMGWRLLPASGIMNQNFWEDRQENFKFWAEEGYESNVFNPLTNANHWMMVVERMRGLGWKGFRLQRFCLDKKFGVHFWKEIEIDGPVVYAFGDLGHAVCEAALRALG